MSSRPALHLHVSGYGHESTHDATGIFFDPLTATPSAINTVGAVLEPSPPRIGPLVTPYQQPGMFLLGVFLSTLGRLDAVIDHRDGLWNALCNRASLAGARMVKVQKVGVRCVGLLAEFQGWKVPVTIGQWDASDFRTIYTIHDTERDGMLESITFSFSPTDIRERYVTDIIANSDADRAQRPYFRCDDLSKVVNYLVSRGNNPVNRDQGLILCSLGNSVVLYTPA